MSPVLIRSLVLLHVVLTLALLSGCVYYNTFYHAQEAAREAELLREERPPDSEPGIQEKQLLERVVEKSGRVLREHPDSSWADDALLLIGTALYQQGKYESAEARLTEFQTRFPESDLRYEADFTLAAVLLAKGSPISAEGLLEAVAFAEPPTRLSDDALMLMGRARTERKMYEDAAETFLVALDHFPNSNRRAEIRFLAAENYVQAGRPEDAAVHYSAVAGERGARNLLFEARMRLAEVMIDLEDPEGALEVLDDLERRTEARDDLDRILLMEGRTYEAIGDFEQAISTYEGIAASHEKSEASSEALYRIGLIQRDEWEDLDEASETFESARDESPRSDVGKLASEAAADIETLKGYLGEIEAYIAAPPEPADAGVEDSEIEGGEARDDVPDEGLIGAPPDSSVGDQDTRAGDGSAPAGEESAPTGGEIASIGGEVAPAGDEGASTGGEIAPTGDVGLPDETPAEAGVDSLPRRPPERTEYYPDGVRPGEHPLGDDPRERLAMGALPESLRQRWDEAAREDSLRRQERGRPDRRPSDAGPSSSLSALPGAIPPAGAVIDTIAARGAAGTSGPVGTPGQDPAAATPPEPDAGVASARFRLAELYLFKLDDHEKAAEYYQAVVTEHPGNTHAPRAALALAWILETKTSDTDAAIEAYLAAVESYPGTEQAESARESIERLGGQAPPPAETPELPEDDAPEAIEATDEIEAAEDTGAQEVTDAPGETGTQEVMDAPGETGTQEATDALSETGTQDVSDPPGETGAQDATDAPEQTEAQEATELPEPAATEPAPGDDQTQETEGEEEE